MANIGRIGSDRRSLLSLRTEPLIAGSGSFSLFRSVTVAMIVILVVIVGLVWVVVGAGLFGYTVVDTRGNSMAPVLQDGDILWETGIDISEIKTGYVVTLGERNASITHRVVSSEITDDGSYFLVTKGDANLYTEAWHILPDTDIPVMVGRIPFAGYVLAFISNTPFKIGLAVFAVISLLVLIYGKYRQRVAVKADGMPVR